MANFIHKLLILCVLCIYTTLYTQALPPIQSFPMEEYAAGNQNWSLTQGKNDEIYIANNKGILKYDAERWTLYPTNSIVRSVAVFDGVLYSGSYMDFGYWEEQVTGELVYQSLVEQYEIQLIEDEQFWHIYQVEDTLIFQSLNRLFLWNQSTNQFKQIQPDKAIIKSFVVNQQLFFHLENDGIYKYDSEGIRYLFGKTEFKDTEVIDLFSLSDGFSNSDFIQGILYLFESIFASLEYSNLYFKKRTRLQWLAVFQWGLHNWHGNKWIVYHL